MPEQEFVVEWPDGSRERCYSPSRAIGEHLAQGASYPLPEFVDRARSGLGAAAHRVLEVHGFLCPRALEQLRTLERRAAGFAEAPGGEAVVRVVTLRPWP